VLVQRSRGEILARLDGDITVLTENWAQKLCAIFDQGPPRLGVVGPKQLTPNGRIHAFGDWVLHPKGYHHIAMGMERHAVSRPIEVDHVIGCFYCCRREVHEQIGGYDETILRGQTVDFGLQARLKGWSCIAVPQIEFIHRHSLRDGRATKADQADGIAQTRTTFLRKWGFDRIAPDLDVVRQRYRGTDLLWNASVFATPPPVAPSTAATANAEAAPAPLTIQSSPWGRYTNDGADKQQVDYRVGLTLHVVQSTGLAKKVAVIGDGAGPMPHLLATHGLACMGVDSNLAHVEFARGCVKNQKYPESVATVCSPG
jgi:hypothetical protein